MKPETSLDPQDWEDLRQQGHRMLDDMIDHLATLREQPLWRAPPAELRAKFRSPPPFEATALGAVHADFLADVLPYSSGNAHPGFMGWVQGGGSPVGMLAEMLAGGMNANLGGRDHMPIEVERQIIGWMRDIFGFPETASGVFVTGTSMANLLAVLVARTRALGLQVRKDGVAAGGPRLAAYASSAVHACVPRALDVAGLGSACLRLIETDEGGRIRADALRTQIDHDRRSGFTPFLLVGTAGTVDTGAIDDLAALADQASDQGLWFHVDGAFGALAVLAPDLAPALAGVERADSIAFDFHKWGQVPYDAGFLLVRDGDLHRRTFADNSAYLRRAGRGLAAGDWWPCDYGVDLSRGFRALKTWFTLKTYGLSAIGASISQTCALARSLAEHIEREPELELLAPVSLNIVCFSFRRPDSDRIVEDVVTELQLMGRVAPSTTMIGDRLAIRAAIFNHRTDVEDIEALVALALQLSRSMRPTD